MGYILIFLIDGVFGYFLQAFGYVLSLFAFVKRKIDLKTNMLVVIIMSVLTFLIRKIYVISFGYHTVLIMIAFILVAVIWLKIPTFLAVISVLTTTLVVIICETLNIGILSLIFGQETVLSILKNSVTVTDQICKSLLGAPTNIVLVIVMYIFYKLRTRKKDLENGKIN